MRSAPQSFWPLLRLVVFVAMIAVVVFYFDWKDVGLSISRLRPGYLLPVVFVLTPLSVVLRSLRWRGLVVGGHQVPLHRYLRAYLVGFLANSLLPGKLGDLLKARLICQPGVEYGSSLGAALADRVVEGASLLLLLLPALFVGDLPSWAHRVAVWAGIASLILLALIGLLFRYRRSLSQLAAQALFFLSQDLRNHIARSVLRFLEGFESFTSGRRLVQALSYSLGVWIVEILAVAAFLAAFSIPAPWLLAALLILVALNFGTLVPVSPGSIGLYQLLCVSALSMWHVDRDLSFSMGLSMQAVLFLPVYAAGLVCLLVSRKKKEMAAPELAIGRAGG